ncbi:BREX system P-loop protein BrxC [Agromyces sp. C10]|uniref:BREX system P-loop protein BrxC n=1 Tax=Agromyces sp. C10 TaxID=2935077 RepID=UPI00200B5565|nr:BREX system P-loop protein BrxC [Agromyces sp. C10]MCK8609316.1 BREX system P-loop protein BrxC [Agromyces sp. C10]
MTKNWELFAEDPRVSTIPNLGVAKVGDEADDAAINTLRYELRSFVCDGAYERGLDLILDSYLKNVGSQQPAAWVSGFYGSGKSHLVKVLEHLWSNAQLPDGSTPRGLVQGIEMIEPYLIELDTLGRRNGGRLAAAGSLLNGPKDINTAFATILLKAAGLPTDIAAARCVLWMAEEGILHDVMEFVSDEGREWNHVLANMYVSELAEAILAIKPDWASGPDMARDQLWRQFHSSESLALPALLDLVDAVLTSVSDAPGRLPATLVVLDEMQAFIGDDAGRAGEVQGLIEACSSRFGGLLLIVATGQSDLGATATLQKLIDRFAVRQQLSDADVDHVIRQVVLRKRADRVADLTAILDANAGEIDRQLGGAVIAPASTDADDLVADYPVLPSRRRFWERALQAIDRGGRAGQLRTQLKVVHEALRKVAEDDIGTVVPADFLYGEQESGMITSNVLLREVSDLITSEQSNGPDGPLRSRILALVFLISRLSREGFADTGVRSTPDHIADLLVDDLSSSGQTLRKRVPVLLEQLRSESKLSLVDDEYVLQSKTGQEWNQDYRNRVAGYKADLARVSMDRETLVREELQRLIPRNLSHGESKTSRSISVQFGTNPPTPADDIPVWVRTGWETSETEYQDTAAAAPTDSPVVYVFVPKIAGDELTNALASHAAGSDTINQRPNPTTSEGQEAKKAIHSIVAAADAEIKRLMAGLVRRAIVRQAGGTLVTAQSLSMAIETAAHKSLDRLYPKYSIADAKNWHLVLAHAVAGKPDALSAVGYSAEPAENAVCKEVLAGIPAAGTTGGEIRKRLSASPFGWPRDAVDGALAILVLAGNIAAQFNGADIAASELKATSIGKTVFRREAVTLDMSTRLKARGVLTALGLQVTPNEEAPACSGLITTLDVLMRSAGGDKPLPPPMTSEILGELKSRSGAELVLYVATHDGEIKQLAHDATDRGTRKDKALKAFGMAESLVAHLPASHDFRHQLAAVAENRSLLEIPDPVGPIVAAAAAELRDVIGAKFTMYATAVADATAELQADIAWKELTDAQAASILRETSLVAHEMPSLGTTDEVLAALSARPLPSWDDLFAALPARVGKARDLAVRVLEPDAVTISLPKATLKNSDDIEAYMDRLRALLTAAVAEHKSIVI